MIKEGSIVKISPEHYDTMTGTVDRIVKMDRPCEPTDDQSKWTVHVLVISNHPRNSGTFCIPFNDCKLVK